MPGPAGAAATLLLRSAVHGHGTRAKHERANGAQTAHKHQKVEEIHSGYPSKRRQVGILRGRRLRAIRKYTYVIGMRACRFFTSVYLVKRNGLPPQSRNATGGARLIARQ